MTFRLGTYGSLALELKSAVIFGVTAMVLSLLTGLLSGNSAGNALFTSLIITLVFAGIGYGAILILRRFVPEVLDVFDVPAPDGEGGGGEEIEASSKKEDTAGETPGEAPAEDGVPRTDEGLKKEFEPFRAGDFKSYESRTDGDVGSLGKHFMSEQKTVKYEPKIIAEAIRTMIRRDEKD